MDEDLEMNVLRQKALSTIHPKRRDHREKQEVQYVSGGNKRELLRSSIQPHISRRDQHTGFQEKLRPRAEQSRKSSSSLSSRQSYSRSHSYSSYSSTGSTTSHSRSSSSVSHSSYSSYTKSSYSSSRRSLSTSPLSKRRGIKHSSFNEDLPHELGPRSSSRSRVSTSSRRYPTSSRWYDDNHKVHSRRLSRSPLRASKSYSHPTHHTRDSYHNYPPVRRHPNEYLEYRRTPPPTERSRLRSPPPPPPPPALQRRERIIQRVHRSRSPRSLPLQSRSSRSHHGRRLSSPPHYMSRHYRSRRSYSPLTHSSYSRDVKTRRDMPSDRMKLTPSSRDVRSLCGPPIHVRHRLPRRSPEMSSRRFSYKSATSSTGSYRHGRNSLSRHVIPNVRDNLSSTRRKRRYDTLRRNSDEAYRTEKVESVRETGGKELRSVADDEQNSSEHPSLTSPTTAQLLWDEEEAELDNKGDGDIPTNVSAEEGEVEELDYDESMEDLDLHPTGNIDEEVGALSSKLTVKLDVEKPGTMSWDERDKGVKEVIVPESGVERLAKGEEKETAHEDDSVPEPGLHISSPIRVSPEHKRSRGKGTSPQSKKLSVKDRLYVSRNKIEEKRRRIGGDDTSSKLPKSLANRLGPSPAVHHRTKISQKSSSGHKGSALAIAAEYKRRRQAGEISPTEAARVARITQRLNVADHQPVTKKQEVKSEENERELDKKIDTIKKRNKALEKRYKEIERDKQLYG